MVAGVRRTCPVRVTDVSGFCDHCAMRMATRRYALPRIQAGRSWGLFGHAHICEGSVVTATVLGWMPKHAIARARRRLDVAVPAVVVRP